MIDRESLVDFLREQAKSAAGADSNNPIERMIADAIAAAAETFANQIERGNDLTPAKPKATIADLLALHDLDLGALAHAAGVIGDDLDDGDTKVLCDKYSSVNDWHELVADVLPSHAATWDARQSASLGAKVRAALSVPTSKAATPRVLQSADEAPCGSVLMCKKDGSISMRFPSGRGWHIIATAPTEPTRRPGWQWHEHDIKGPVTVLAEGLTEAECRHLHLSGLSSADALTWCEDRARLLAK